MKKIVFALCLLVAFSASVYADMSIESLKDESSSNLSAYGELAEMFKFDSKNTDIQRKKKEKEIIGKVVQWELPVYEVRESRNGYRIQTSKKEVDFEARMNAVRLLGATALIATKDNDPVSTIIEISARSEKEKQFIESLKTGDMISFKGVIQGVSTMRLIEIEPAILILGSTHAETPKQPETKQEVVNEQQQQSEPEVTASNQYKALWVGNWGNEILAYVFNQPCNMKNLTDAGYNYIIAASIPISRLKNKNDAWESQGDRAITVTGCWFKKSDNLIHAKIIRKKDGKVTEQDFDMTESIWTAQ